MPKLHFPGLHPDAAKWLVAKGVRAVGIDTASIDYGQSTLFESHRILYAADLPAFENLTALDRLPVRGAFIVALPMKIARWNRRAAARGGDPAEVRRSGGRYPPQGGPKSTGSIVLRRGVMNRRIALVLIGLACAAWYRSPERQRLDDAAEALGGVERIKALQLRPPWDGLCAECRPEPDARRRAAGMEAERIHAHVDLANSRSQVRQVREAQFLFAGDLVQQQTQGLDGDVAYNVAPDGSEDACRRGRRAAIVASRCSTIRSPSSARRWTPDAEVSKTVRIEGNEELVDITTPRRRASRWPSTRPRTCRHG